MCKDKVYFGGKLCGWVENDFGSNKGLSEMNESKKHEENPLTRREVEDFLSEVRQVCKKYNIEMYADCGGEIGLQRPSRRQYQFELEDFDGVFSIASIASEQDEVCTCFSMKSPEEVIAENFNVLSDIDRDLLVSYIEEKNKFYLNKLKQAYGDLSLNSNVKPDELQETMFKIQDEWDMQFKKNQSLYSKEMMDFHNHILSISL